MKETKPRKKYFKSPERHLLSNNIAGSFVIPRGLPCSPKSEMITKTIVKTVPKVIYVVDEYEYIAAMLRKQDKKK
jgi:hypothetical protein